MIVLFMYALQRVHTQEPEKPDENENAEFRRFVRNAVLSAAAIAIATDVCDLEVRQLVLAEREDLSTASRSSSGSCCRRTRCCAKRYPSLVQTVLNVDQWLRSFRRVGAALAWVVGFLLVWGMVFLLLHLTLYPFPNITRELNHTEITCGTDVVSRWHEGCVVHG